MATKNTNFNFEKSLQELDAIVQAMEHGELELEQSLKQFEKGVKIIHECQNALKNAEQKIQILTKESPEFVLEEYNEE